MTLGAIVVPEAKLVGAMPQAPLYAINVSFLGDDDYTTGGTVDFAVAFRAAIEAKMKAATDANVRGRQNVEIVALIPGVCGAYDPIYDRENDTLIVFVKATGVEVANAFDLIGTTFNVTLLCK